MKERIADFVHGNDGLGNINPTPSTRKAIETFGPDFLRQKVNDSPGEITIVALGPLTNLAKVGRFYFLLHNILFRQTEIDGIIRLLDLKMTTLAEDR